jgi:hypothetical protein
MDRAQKWINRHNRQRHDQAKGHRNTGFLDLQLRENAYQYLRSNRAAKRVMVIRLPFPDYTISVGGQMKFGKEIRFIGSLSHKTITDMDLMITDISNGFVGGD